MARAKEPPALKLFISYSRQDSEAADALVATLEAEGFEVTIDRRDLPFGEEWQGELRDFILGSDTVIWLVSPASVSSRWVNWELGEVQRAGKRLMPLVVQETDPTTLPDALGKLHLLPASGAFDRATHLEALVEALRTDRAWIKEHSRLGDRAREWVAAGRGRDRLLRGGALSSAEDWRSRQPEAAPAPSPEILDLLAASERAAKARQRNWITGSLVVAFCAVALAAFAVLQRQEAVIQREAAVENERVAKEQRDEALITQSRFLSDLAQQAVAEGDAVTGALLALEALPSEADPRPYVPQAEDVAFKAESARRERAILREPRGHSIDAGFSPDDSYVLSRSGVTAKLWEAESGAEVAAFNRSQGSITFADFDKDGHPIAFTAIDEEVHTWSILSGARLATLEGRHGEIKNIAFDPSRGRIVTHEWIDVYNKSITRIFDATSGDIIATINAGVPGNIEFSPDGSTVVAVSADGSVRLFEASSGAEAVRFGDHAINFAQQSKDGAKTLAITYKNSVVIWDTTTGAEISTLVGHDRSISSAAFSPDGERVVTASHDRTARVWNASTGAEIAVMAEHEGFMVLDAAFSPDGTKIVTASDDNTARVWDAASGAEIAKFIGHGDGVESVAFSSDGAKVLTVSYDATVRVWDTRYSPESVTLDAKGSSFKSAFLGPDGKRILTAQSDNTSRVWNAFSGDEILRIEEHDHEVNSAVFNLDGTLFATASIDGTARIWDATSAEAAISSRLLHAGSINTVTFNPDGTKVVTASYDKSARLWDATTGRLIEFLMGHSSEVNSAAFSPDGSLIVTASADNTARVWNGVSGEEIAVLEGHSGCLDCTSVYEYRGVTSALFDPKGEKIVTVSVDGTARLWEASTGAELAVFGGHTGRVLGAAFSPDGSRIATASDDGTARVWEIETGKSTAVLLGHENDVQSITFSPDGARLLTASKDSTARIWDSDTGAQVSLLAGHRGWVNTAVFSRDGKRVVTAADDGTARVWNVWPDTRSLVAQMKTTAPRCLSPTQREAAFLSPAPPRWCITGPDAEGSTDPADWKPKYPYDTEAWRDWLVARDRGEDPPLPSDG